MALIETLFGTGTDLGVLQMMARAIVVFALTLAMIRWGGRRSFGQRSPFDACMAVLLGAVLSRAVVGASPLLATIGAGLIIVLLHRWTGWLSLRWPAFDALVNGSERVLISQGVKDPDALRKGLVSDADLAEAARKHFGADTQGKILRAVLERDGTVTVALQQPND